MTVASPSDYRIGLGAMVPRASHTDFEMDFAMLRGRCLIRQRNAEVIVSCGLDSFLSLLNNCF